jgi:hypothetical protein
VNVPVNAPDELIRLAELIERNVAAYSQADVAESLYYAGRVAAYRWCAAEARRAAAALGCGEQACVRTPTALVLQSPADGGTPRNHYSAACTGLSGPR